MSEVEIRAAAHTFVTAAFARLRAEHVIPTPTAHPFVHVGRDYFGDDVRGPESHALERLLDAAYPERFAKPETGFHRDFASGHVFTLLEACVARCGRMDDFDDFVPAVDQSVDELLAVLGATSYDVIACRFVGHMTTTTGEDVDVAGVTVVPEIVDPMRPHLRNQLLRIIEEIPGAMGTFNRDDPRHFEPPHALLIARVVADDPQPFSATHQASARLDRFLLLTRLLRAGTAQSLYEVRGLPTLVSPIPADYIRFPREWIGAPIRRTVRFAGDETEAYEGLAHLIDTVEIDREGMAANPLDIALGRFVASHTSGNSFEQLVDLATALEAILSNGERDANTFRLRNRAAALLATQDDGATAVFDDVGRLYRLRSAVVHGVHMSSETLRNVVAGISTIEQETVETLFGIAAAQAADRLRDLVRRAILARLCLAAEPDPMWPFARSPKITPVDSVLAADLARSAWRARYHERMAELGAAGAVERPRAAVWHASQEDR